MKIPLIILILSAFFYTSSHAAPRPNIVLVMADDMGWGDPGYNSMNVTYADGSPHPDQGWINTPTMDAMAANGLRFDRFYSASAVCSPTRASCLLGRNPFRAGVPFANQGRLEFDESPLSEVLSEVGYRCGHFGKWHLGAMTTLRDDANRGGVGSEGIYSGPWHHRYDACFATESKVPTYHPYRTRNNNAALPTSFSDPNFYGTYYWRNPATWNEASGEGEAVPVAEVNDLANGDDSKLIVDQTIPFIQEAVAEGKPFFAVVWFHTPHKPTMDPQGVSGIDSPDTVKDSIEDMDIALGRLRDELTALGVRDNTMIWVTSDNGPENGQDSFNETSTSRSIRSGRLRARKRSLYEGGVRVPGILEWPDVITTGTSTNVPAVTSDYYPTILDYLELSVPSQKPMDGISLRPVIEGTSTERGKPIGFKISASNSWVNQQYKLISTGGDWELYDLINISAGEEAEQTPLATTSNVSSQPQEIQDIYQTMLAEFTAWDATLLPDTPYVHSSQPSVSLSTASSEVTESFVVTATFNEAVTQLHAHEFTVSNGVASSLTGSGMNWSVTILPSSGGEVMIDLPEGAVIDKQGNPNGGSNQLGVTYTNPLAPDVSLTTPTTSVDASFEVMATFTQDVTGLEAEDFVVTNGTASNFVGEPSVFTVTITPSATGDVVVFLPGSVAQDGAANGNNASNMLTVDYVMPALPTALRVFNLTSSQTVDSSANVPGDQDNNLLKFTAGNANDGVPNPYTTTLYLRGSTGNALRTVRAYVRFDLSALNGLPITKATLTFNGHSLNDQEAVDVEVLALATDWSEAGAPLAVFNPATNGEAVSGGSLITNLDATDHSKDYSFDVTTMVQQWAGGQLQNDGLLVQLSPSNINNGLGIKTSAEGAIQLEVESLTFGIRSIEATANGDVLLEWISIAGTSYRIEASDDLETGWTEVATVTGNAGFTTSYTHVDGMAGFPRKFYRIVYLSN
ncbi:sulfatase-like hydrolase/transferase [Akkermansiaceae bacterium]|nr:sulfatase-like hydrolase/transferase [Akkermansiaceae bacterium]